MDPQGGQIIRTDPRRIYCCLPYLDATSLKVQKSIKGFLRKFDPLGTKFKIIFIDKCTKLENIFKFKDNGPQLMRNNVVYKLDCSCGASYIGQTERNLYSRMDEHAKVVGSSISTVGQHLVDNPGHTVDVKNPAILGWSPYKHKLLLKEALYIQEHQPSLNVQVEAKKLLIFNVY